jgi:hypothetical protein
VAVVIGMHSAIIGIVLVTLVAACVSCGGLVASLKVTRLVGGVDIVGIQIWLSSFFTFCSASIYSMPFMFFFLLLPVLHSWYTIMSSDVKEG